MVDVCYDRWLVAMVSGWLPWWVAGCHGRCLYLLYDGQEVCQCFSIASLGSIEDILTSQQSPDHQGLPIKMKILV